TFAAGLGWGAGCGVGEAGWPVEEWITMVMESVLNDNASQWEMWRKDRPGYKTWLTATIGDKKAAARSHGFRFRGQYDEELKKDLETGGIEIVAGIPGENAARKV